MRHEVFDFDIFPFVVLADKITKVKIKAKNELQSKAKDTARNFRLWIM